MNSGTKMFLWFLTGTAVGAAGLAYLNRNKMDFSYMKPMCTELLSKGINLKDNMMSKMSAMKEDFDDMAAEARDRVDSARLAEEKASEADKK